MAPQSPLNGESDESVESEGAQSRRRSAAGPGHPSELVRLCHMITWWYPQKHSWPVVSYIRQTQSRVLSPVTDKSLHVSPGLPASSAITKPPLLSIPRRSPWLHTIDRRLDRSRTFHHLPLHLRDSTLLCGRWICGAMICTRLRGWAVYNLEVCSEYPQRSTRGTHCSAYTLPATT